MDYYNKLGVRKDATQDEIKSAYKKLVMTHHPDRGGDTAKFAEINEAYEVLKDPAKRAQYDRPATPEFKFNTANMDGMDLNNFHEMFGQFFNQARMTRKNKDIKLAVALTLEEVALGKDIVGNYTLPSGRVETANIKIPSGIENGETIRFKGLGDDTLRDLPRGDLHVVVKILPHEKYTRDGLHIVVKEPVNVFDLIQGTTLKIQDLTGNMLNVTINKGTQPGTTLSVSGHGISDHRTGKTGNLYIVIRGIIPEISDPDILSRIKEISNEISNSTR